jgi:hypothetical protein
MTIEIGYLGRENTIDLLLQSNGSAVDLSGTTSMSLKLGAVVLTSTNSTAQGITWNGVGYATGEVRLHLGSTAITVTAGVYDANLSAADASTPNGVIWSNIGIELKTDPMAT